MTRSRYPDKLARWGYRKGDERMPSLDELRARQLGAQRRAALRRQDRQAERVG